MSLALFYWPYGPISPALQVTSAQAGVLVATDLNLEAAFLYGVIGSGTIIDPIIGYGLIVLATHPIVRSAFMSLAAAIVSVCNIPRALPDGITAVLPIAKLTALGANGSLTFVDGFLVSKVNPT